MIDFIVTAYNRPRELATLLASLDAQTNQDYETIIVDDNSSQEEVRTIARNFLERHGGYFTQSDVLDENRKARVRYAENINHILSIADRVLHGDLIAYLCDDVELATEYVERVTAHFNGRPDHLAGYVSEEWVTPQDEAIKVLWYGAPVYSAFCALDHSQVIHRKECAQPWVIHPLAWAFADGIFFERLLGRVGCFHPIGDATPLVTNKILETSVCRQPIGAALDKLQEV